MKKVNKRISEKKKLYVRFKETRVLLTNYLMFSPVSNFKLIDLIFNLKTSQILYFFYLKKIMQNISSTLDQNGAKNIFNKFRIAKIKANLSSIENKFPIK